MNVSSAHVDHEWAPSGGDAAKVVAVMPVFNRVNHTLDCLRCLYEQNFGDMLAVVVDGGSTDGTPSIVKQSFPDAVVLSDARELWWGGATAKGIDWALNELEVPDDAFILLVNNDTVFGPDTVRHLIETSALHNAAVGGAVVDACDPDTLIDGGVCFTWRPFRFTTVKQFPEGMRVNLECDVLPGRCTLIPVRAIRLAGNVAWRRFPHYLADYEFTHRLKRRAGLTLAVDYRVRVATSVDMPSDAEAPDRARNTEQVVRSATSRRSKSNIFDHVNFYLCHAPRHLLPGLLARIGFAHIVMIARSKAWIREPFYWVRRQRDRLIAYAASKSWARNVINRIRGRHGSRTTNGTR